MNRPSWNYAPEWARWSAQDSDGTWFWFEFKPVRGGDAWFVKNRGRYMRANFEDDSWASTLERRAK